MNKSTYDSYIKAFRWSSDRIPKDEGGIVAFISNGAWLDGNAQDGMRRCLEEEFSSIYVLNLRGNQRTSGELSRKEGGKIFGSGSRTPIAITFLVKNPKAENKKAKIYYRDIGDYLTREQKLQMVKDFGSIESVQWDTITPNDKADWINQRDGLFETLIPICPEKGKEQKCFYSITSYATITCRDAWCYNSSLKKLKENLSLSIDFYNSEVDRITDLLRNDKSLKVEDLLTYDSKKFTWDRAQKQSDVPNGRKYKFSEENVFVTQYRPFFIQNGYMSRQMNNCVYKMPKYYPMPNSENIVICVSGVGVTKDYSCLITRVNPDHELIGKCQCLPLYWYEENEKSQRTLFDEATDDKYIRHDGITDWILKEVRGRFSGTKMINKETIFYYVYGLLHSPQYRTRFADDLRKSLPRIPIVDKIEDFMLFSKIGKQLADLHLNYEQVPPAEQVKVFMNNCPVSKEQLQTWFAEPNGEELLKKAYPYYSVEKMRFEKVRDENGKLVPDKSVIIYNNNIRLENIPQEAYDYIVNGKSAIEWIMERYAISTDSASGITNDPNDWSKEHQKPTYILDLLLSIINLSIQTNSLVAQLPSLPFVIDAPKNEASTQQGSKSNKGGKKKHYKNKNHGKTTTVVHYHIDHVDTLNDNSRNITIK